MTDRCVAELSVIEQESVLGSTHPPLFDPLAERLEQNFRR